MAEEEITFEQKFEKIEKYHNNPGFLYFLKDFIKNNDDDSYDKEAALDFLRELNKKVEDGDKLKGKDRLIGFESLYYTMDKYDADMKEKRDTIQKLMADEEKESIQGKLNEMKKSLPSLKDISASAQAKVGDLKEKAATRLSSLFTSKKEAEKTEPVESTEGGKRKSKKNKSKKNKSKKSKKSKK